MQPDQINELLKYLDDIVAATNLEKLAWSQANPTTYVHSPSNLPGKLIIQKVDALNYLFQANRSASTALEFHGSTNREVNAKLNELFKTIERKRDEKGLNFLKSFIQ